MELDYKSLKTPCYVIDEAVFEATLQDIRNSFAAHWGKNMILGYSVKTNHNGSLLQCAKDNGMYAECVSAEELFLAKEAGFSGDNCILNGPQVDEELLLSAIRSGCLVNLDNVSELAVLEKNQEKVSPQTRLGLRVNFDLEAKCPGETHTGSTGSRFGFCVENGEFDAAVQRLTALGIPVRGLHLHVTTKTRSCGVYRALVGEAVRLIQLYGWEDTLEYLDIGGGFWGGRKLAGKPTMDEYAQEIVSCLTGVLNPERVTLILEPGSALLSTAAEYITKVINTRQVRQTRILTVDGSVLHINPFMNSREPIYSVTFDESCTAEKQVICGATCLEFDRFCEISKGGKARVGDYLICHYVGAYTMGFNTCFINTPPYIYVKKKNGSVVLQRDKDLRWMLQL